MLLSMLEKSVSLKIGSISYYNSKTPVFSHFKIRKILHFCQSQIERVFPEGLVLVFPSHLGQLSSEYYLIFLLRIVWTTLVQGILDCRLTQVLACDSNYQIKLLFFPTSSAKIEACNFPHRWVYALIKLTLQAFSVPVLHKISQSQMFYLLYW